MDLETFEEFDSQNFSLTMDIEALKIMQKMGFKCGSNFEKKERGIKDHVNTDFQMGRVESGLEPLEYPNNWDFSNDDVNIMEKVNWYNCESSESFYCFKEMLSWLKEGSPKHEVEKETNFCNETLIRDVLQAKEIFNELDITALSYARSRANPFESIRSMFFMNRAAMKMANIDAATDFMFSNIHENVHHKNHSGPFYFADVCAGPGGFSEYMFWRQGWKFKGFGLTLKDDNDFNLNQSTCISGGSFEALYGRDGDGNVCSPDNIADFKEKVLHETDGEGVHFMMSDGGFSVQGQENLQEILSKNIYICQCLVALEIVREHGHFVTKLFDLFTLFSVGLLFSLSRCFEKVCILKPNTSRPANSERYFVCSNLKKGQCYNEIKKYLWAIVKKLWELKDDKSVDILEIIPLEVIKSDETFFNYILKVNNRLASKQILGLKKLEIFCRNPKLRDTRQKELKKACLESWKIPDKPKTYPVQIPIDEFVKSIIDKPEILLVQPREVINVDTFNNILTDVVEWNYCKMGNLICNFYVGVGASRTYRLQRNKWVKMKNLQLHNGTLLYGEYIKEAFVLKNSKQTGYKYSLHVIDALRLGDKSLTNLTFQERAEVIKIYCKSLNKEFQENSVRIREKPFKPFTNIMFDNNLIKHDGDTYLSVLPVLGHMVAKESYVVKSLLLLKTGDRQSFYSTYVLRVQICLNSKGNEKNMGIHVENVIEQVQRRL